MKWKTPGKKWKLLVFIPFCLYSRVDFFLAFRPRIVIEADLFCWDAMGKRQFALVTDLFVQEMTGNLWEISLNAYRSSCYCLTSKLDKQKFRVWLLILIAGCWSAIDDRFMKTGKQNPLKCVAFPPFILHYIPGPIITLKNQCFFMYFLISGKIDRLYIPTNSKETVSVPVYCLVYSE